MSGGYAPNGTEGVSRVGGDSEELKAPDNVIPNAQAGLVVYRRLREDHLKRSKVYAKIQGMLDGNPPYSRAEQVRSGASARSNVNWRDGTAIKESYELTYWSLFNEVQYIAQFITTFASAEENATIGQIVSEEFDRIMRDWDVFQELMAQHQDDNVVFGNSFLIWLDPKDWRFEPIDIWQFLVPNKTRNSVRHWSKFAVEHYMEVSELWNKYESSTTSSRWNKDALREILWNLTNQNKDATLDDNSFRELQRQRKNNDGGVGATQTEDVMVVSVYSKEYDGNVSRGILFPNYPHKEWLFFYDRQYESMKEAVHMFTFTPGERYVHGNKGVGHRIFNTVEGVTRLDNNLMDGAANASTVLVRSRASRGKDPRQLKWNQGGIVDIGEADFVENLMSANLQSNVSVAQYFRNKLETNNSISGISMATPDGKPRSAAEVKVGVTKEARVQKSRISHYYGQGDMWVREVARKMLNSKPGYPGYDVVDLWKKRCIKRGVPAEFFEVTLENVGQNGLPEHMSLALVRASGSGSQVADQVESETMMQILPTVGERGRQHILQDFVAAHRGFRYIERYMPPEDAGDQPVQADTIASIENNQLEKGEMVIVSPDNNHAVHAPRHIERMQQLAQAFQQAEEQARQAGSKTPEVDAGQYGQYSLEDMDTAFQTLGPHFVRHLIYLSQDPTRKSIAQSLNAKWAILANFGDKIANNAQASREKQLRDQQAQQAQMDQMPMEERVKMAQVESDSRIKTTKLLNDMQRAATRDQLQYLVQRMRVSNENQVQRARAVAEISREDQKVAHEMLQSERDQALGRKETSPY